MKTITESKDISLAIQKATERAINSFEKYSENQLKRLWRLYYEARKEIERQIALKWADWTKDVASPTAIGRLRELQDAIAAEMEILNAKLRRQVPQAVRGAGEKGIQFGQAQMAALLDNIETTLRPAFTVINRAAIEVYANYALQLVDADTVVATRQIQSRLQQGLIQADTIQKLTTDIRQMIGAEFGKPAKGLTYKAQRIARTEMARAFTSGHTAFGKSTDWIIGERWMVNSIGPWPCPECAEREGREYYYAKGERAEIPLHPMCRCYPMYIYRKDLFTKEELEKLKMEVKGVYEPSLETRFLRAEESIMNEFKKDGLEHTTILDEKGNIIFTKTGTKNQIVLSPSEAEILYRQKIHSLTMIHNHPNSSSFSDSDLIFAKRVQLKRLRVVSDKYKYEVYPKKLGAWPDEYTIRINYLEEKSRLYDKYFDKVQKGLLSEAEAWQQHSHEIMKNLSKRFDLVYKRTKVAKEFVKLKFRLPAIVGSEKDKKLVMKWLDEIPASVKKLIDAKTISIGREGFGMNLNYYAYRDRLLRLSAVHKNTFYHELGHAIQTSIPSSEWRNFVKIHADTLEKFKFPKKIVKRFRDLAKIENLGSREWFMQCTEKQFKDFSAISENWAQFVSMKLMKVPKNEIVKVMKNEKLINAFESALKKVGVTW